VGERLYLHRHSLVHSLPSHLKIIAAIAFILVVVSTPITQWGAFIAYFLWLLTVVSIAKIPFPLLFKRALIEIPFIFFAVLMPFFGSGEKIQVGPFDLYREGVIAGSGIVAKGTLGVMTAIILSTSTTAREILRGLERLRLPVLMVQIASFMLRYVNVVNDEMKQQELSTGKFWPRLLEHYSFAHMNEEKESTFLCCLVDMKEFCLMKSRPNTQPRFGSRQ